MSNGHKIVTGEIFIDVVDTQDDGGPLFFMLNVVTGHVAWGVDNMKSLLLDYAATQSDLQALCFDEQKKLT
jgi:hypothetical protein